MDIVLRKLSFIFSLIDKRGIDHRLLGIFDMFDVCFTAECASDKGLQKWLIFASVTTKSGLIFGQCCVSNVG